MKKIKYNFSLGHKSESFKHTEDFVNALIKKAELEGRTYLYEDLNYDYFLPEKTHIDHEIQCPFFEVQELVKISTNNHVNNSNNLLGMNKEREPVQTVAYIEVRGEELRIPFIRAFQSSGIYNKQELILFALSISYLKFKMRDWRRGRAVYYWDYIVENCIVSHDTVLLFEEDVEIAEAWASFNFSRNILNAKIGKCGEFAFRGWASQQSIHLSLVDIRFDKQADEYDFINQPSFFFGVQDSIFFDKEKIKIDI